MVHGYKLVKKEGKELSDMRPSDPNFDPLIAIQKLKNFMNKNTVPIDGFKIPQTPQRELLSNQIVQKAEDSKKRIQKQQHKKQQDRLDMATGRIKRPSEVISSRTSRYANLFIFSTRDKYQNLSGAAKKLANSIHQKSSIRPMSFKSSGKRPSGVEDWATPKIKK